MHDLGSATIRPATPEDAPELATLRYRFRAEVGEPIEDEAAFVARATPWFAEHLGGPAWRGWVVVVEGEGLVGLALLQLVEKVPNPVVEAEQLGYITSVYIRPEHRGRGLGARLVAAALAACPPETVDTVVLWPTSSSAALYARAGFRAPATMLERPAGSGRPTTDDRRR